MTDPRDEDALTWDGDEELRAPREPRPRLIDDTAAEAGAPASGGPVALLVLGVLGGVAVLETLFWYRGATQLDIAASLDTGSGTAVEIGAYVLNWAGRALAVLAPLIWFALIAWRVRVPSRRLALLVLGAVLLVPWPVILMASS